MTFEPQKFFIGLVDFFAVIMPGALVAYAGKDWVAAQLGRSSFALDSTEAGLVFLFASYLLGHFAFLLGALLDSWLYGPVRTGTLWGQIERLADGKPLSSSRHRALATALFGKSADTAVIHAQRIKARALHALDADDAVNAFQWCKARLSLDHPEGLTGVQRSEADSKFFRSFAIVLTALAAFYLWQQQFPRAALCAFAVLPALWRYADQRFKATQSAYRLVITIQAGVPMPPAAGPTGHGLTHAGGVVYRTRGAGVEYLLVQASRDRSQWVLPKGHIEPGEEPRVTAVREVLEEAGWWASVRGWIDDASISTPDPQNIRFYLMDAVEDSFDQPDGRSWPAENRAHQWLPLAQAKGTATFDETTLLLEKADELRKKKTGS